jgi:hypothetical protein
MKKGVFCVSIDLELLWGRKDLDISKFEDKVKKERVIIKKLLKLFKKYKIPVTWAVVGKLYEKGDNLWSGRDIVKWIEKDKIHELASHSYSHEIFTKISKDKADSEIKKAKAKSFVYPKNQIKYLNILKRYKFKSFRGKDKSEYELLIPRIPPVGNIKITNGLIEIPSSMYFVSARGMKKYIPNNLRFFKSKMGINHAISKKEIYHLWFHPIDFVDNSISLLKELERILMYADKKRKENILQIKTMEQIANKQSL